MEVILIRHFKTEGNLHARYIGVTDEDIISMVSPQNRWKEEYEQVLYEQEEKIKQWKDSLSHYHEVEVVYSSPLKRCLQTSKLLFSKKEPIIVDELRECDFGTFENKNYIKLRENPQYQEWVDSKGTIAFPKGEHPEGFKQRSREAFAKVVNESRERGHQSIAMVVHGGTIMSVLDGYGHEEKSFYEYQVKNGEGYILLANQKLIAAKEKSQTNGSVKILLSV